MSTIEYTALPYEEKRELLRLNGSFLAEKVIGSSGKKAIYALYGFFVELDYDLSNNERYIRVVESYFDTDHQLEGIFINLN
jgi:hypothetical protein